ncbi:adenosylcobinamide-GDP ribazoletransferase [Halomonas binhaiensis]|uniref:Adenosylcobinamide-GDP ribazoletransferase n=1 Tax=Halomonas binhaiensis TaxID=2562282 RepID=A0A5C1NF03_9GAMM|nr:adenosylcobinamide-GDP ribazoletransferase [Halomonas binhaiensis]QEM82302.1 adenosylcobinamide-GDP ribazoletransferase [Halomonas binhaiensis]
MTQSTREETHKPQGDRRDAAHGLGLAIQFLTRIPLPVACDWNQASRRWAARAYPLVGALIGVALGMVSWGSGALGLPLPLQALLIVSLWVGLSGGLHLDGLMDLADALGSNAPLEKRWAIMKDPQVGSFAVVVLVFHLAWKLALVWWLLELEAGIWWLVAIPALARWMAVFLLVRVPAARPEGLAHLWQQSLGPRDLVLATALPVLLSVLPFVLMSSGQAWSMLTLGLATALFVVIFAAGARRTFGGISGDLLGAAIEGGELWLLVWASSWWWFATA